MIKFCWRRHGQKLRRRNLYISKYLSFKKAQSCQFGAQHQMASMLNKTTFKDSGTRNYVSKYNMYPY